MDQLLLKDLENSKLAVEKDWDWDNNSPSPNDDDDEVDYFGNKLYLTKQVSSMREENLNRTKFYEQLEVNLYDLENTNVDLSRKRELDKKRIQSMCENIDYLEQKCEELNGTLECLKTSNKKRRNLINNDCYYSYSSQSESSSEDDNSLMQINRRRSQSLQDLRDFYPQSDEFDSGNNSNSPESSLKPNDNDFIQTLEIRIEELIQSKKKETEKLHLLQARLEALTKENASLQKQIAKLTAEKNKLLALASSPSSPSNLSLPKGPVKFRKFPHFIQDNSPLSSKKSKSKEASTSDNQICSRCSTELNIRSLVNSIEFENDDYHSLEYELARANEQSATTESEERNSSPSTASEQSPSTSPESSPKHDASAAGAPPVLVPIQPNLHEFEQGFLDYFFGTNSILRKIHRRRKMDQTLLPATANNPTSLNSTIFQNPNHSISFSEPFKSIDFNNYDDIEQLHSLLLVEDSEEEEEEEDSCLLKDIGTENVEKFDNRNRKLVLPKPKSLSPIPTNSFDERVLSDIGEVKNIEAKSRSFLWWLLWFFLMIFGTIRFGWQVTRLTIGFFISLILPRRRTKPAALIDSSSIFYPNQFSFRNKKLPIKLK